MYSKKEVAQLKQAFWTAFGKYMQPVLSAEGENINWINYKTGEKDIYFRMHADNKKAIIGIEIAHRDAALQALYFEQFKQLQPILHDALNEEWIWLPLTKNESGKQLSRICTEIKNVRIYNNNDWPQLISFFKPRIIALDGFWSSAKFTFEAMR